MKSGKRDTRVDRRVVEREGREREERERGEWLPTIVDAFLIGNSRATSVKIALQRVNLLTQDSSVGLYFSEFFL